MTDAADPPVAIAFQHRDAFSGAEGEIRGFGGFVRVEGDVDFRWKIKSKARSSSLSVGLRKLDGSSIMLID